MGNWKTFLEELALEWGLNQSLGLGEWERTGKGVSI